MPIPTITALLPGHEGDPFSLSSSGFYLQHDALIAHPWLVHGFSLRRHPVTGKELDLGSGAHRSGASSSATRNDFVTNLVGKAIPLVLPRQTHSDQIHCLDRFPSGESPGEGDALITGLPKLLLGVRVADCLPVLIADESKRVVAAVHAGWRGILAGVVPKTIERMGSRYSTNPQHCVAIIGPSIGSCCYEVGEDVAAPFEDGFAGCVQYLENCSRSRPAPGSGTGSSTTAPFPARMHLDLSSACRSQLMAAGLLNSKIFGNPPCTSCHRAVFFSYRAERDTAGRMLAVIGKTS